MTGGARRKVVGGKGANPAGWVFGILGPMPKEWSDNIVVAELLDEPALSDELTSILQRVEGQGEQVPHVVLNFGSVTYVNSSNLAQMLKLQKVLAGAGRQMKICSVSDEVWSVLMVTGLDKVFRFAPDPLTALAGLQLDDAKSEPG